MFVHSPLYQLADAGTGLDPRSGGIALAELDQTKLTLR